MCKPINNLEPIFGLF